MGSSRTVLLDIDGTLVDSNDLHAEAWVEALEELGYRGDFARLRPLIGMGGDKVIPLVTGHEADSMHGRELSALRSRLFREHYLPHVRPFPGARALLQALLDKGHELVVASSAKHDELDGLLERGGVADLLPKRTSSDDASSSKPDPDIVVAALHQSRLEPEQALMLGDTPYDLLAAAHAGVGFVGLCCGGYEPPALHGALRVYRDPAALLDALGESPFA